MEGFEPITNEYGYIIGLTLYHCATTLIRCHQMLSNTNTYISLPKREKEAKWIHRYPLSSVPLIPTHRDTQIQRLWVAETVKRRIVHPKSPQNQSFLFLG
jgi:hypothetical protein